MNLRWKVNYCDVIKTQGLFVDLVNLRLNNILFFVSMIKLLGCDDGFVHIILKVFIYIIVKA